MVARAQSKKLTSTRDVHIRVRTRLRVAASANSQTKTVSGLPDINENTAQRAWQSHPYRSFIEGLPVWLAILTIYMFAVVYLQSWTFALVFTLVILIMVALLLDVLHHLHNHLQVPEWQRVMYNRWLTKVGRGLLVGFSVYFLLLFLVFAFSFESANDVTFGVGSIFTMVGIGLVFFLLLSYIALIIFLGFPRV